MKLLLVIGVGVIASFGLTVLAEVVRVNLTINSGWWLHPALPWIPLIVGTIIGFAARKQAQLAAALGLAPWSVWLVVAVNGWHSTVSRWATTLALVSVDFALGVGAAALVGRRMDRVVKGGSSPSHEHA
jgi:hypothetical protein